MPVKIRTIIYRIYICLKSNDNKTVCYEIFQCDNQYAQNAILNRDYVKVF